MNLAVSRIRTELQSMRPWYVLTLEVESRSVQQNKDGNTNKPPPPSLSPKSGTADFVCGQGRDCMQIELPSDDYCRDESS